MIDVLRRYPPALAWLTSLGTTQLVLPGYVVMELIQGCRNKAEQDQVERALTTYQIVWPSVAACDAALASFSQHRLSHSLGIIDALIGHTAIELGTPLHTFNQKHYDPITGLTTVQPYAHTTS
jgi:predicted nucleic acid-binding protein